MLIHCLPREYPTALVTNLSLSRNSRSTPPFINKLSMTSHCQPSSQRQGRGVVDPCFAQAPRWITHTQTRDASPIPLTTLPSDNTDQHVSHFKEYNDHNNMVPTKSRLLSDLETRARLPPGSHQTHHASMSSRAPSGHSRTVWV